MIASSIFVGWRVTACVLPGLVVILFGRYWNLPELVNLPNFDLSSILLGGTIFIGGIFLSRHIK